jgi:hypothetical protein
VSCVIRPRGDFVAVLARPRKIQHDSERSVARPESHSQLREWLTTGLSTRGTRATSARRVQRKRASSQCPVKGTGLRATGSTQRLLEAITVYYRNGDHCWGRGSTPDPPGNGGSCSAVNNTVLHTRYTNFELMTPFSTLYRPFDVWHHII